MLSCQLERLAVLTTSVTMSTALHSSPSIPLPSPPHAGLDVAMVPSCPHPCALNMATLDTTRPTLDITSYPHIFDAILTASLSSPATLKSLRALCHAARDAVEAKLARHIAVKSTYANKQRYIRITSGLGVPIPGVRARDYVALMEGREGTALVARAPVARLKRGGGVLASAAASTSSTPPDAPSDAPGRPTPAPDADVTPAQALATITRVLAHTRIADVGNYSIGSDILPLSPWLSLDTVRLPSYQLAGANSDNTTLPAPTVVLSPDARTAFRSTMALLVPGGTRRVVSHEFYDMGLETCVKLLCGCAQRRLVAGLSGPDPNRPRTVGDSAVPMEEEECACQSVTEVVLALVQRFPSATGTKPGCTPGFVPHRVLAVARAFPRANIVLVGAEASRLGRDPPITRPYDLPVSELKRLIVVESELEMWQVEDRIEFVKLAEWKKRVGERRWEVEMGLADVQVLKRAK